MTMRQVVVHPGEDGYWVAECPSLPGCVTQGKTREEALTNAREAIEAYIATLKEDGFSIPEEYFAGPSNPERDSEAQQTRTFPDGLSQQSFEFVNCETGVPDDTSHGVGIDRTRAWNRDYPSAVGHHDVLATLPLDLESGLLQRANRFLVGDPRYFRHDLVRYFDFTNVGALQLFVRNR